MGYLVAIALSFFTVSPRVFADEYVFAFPQADTDIESNYRFFIAITNLDLHDQANVSVSLLGTNKTLKVSPGNTQSIEDIALKDLQFAFDFPLKEKDKFGALGNKRIRIVSDSSISVVAGATGGDAFFVLPVTSLGNHYFVVTGDAEGRCRECEVRSRTQIVVVNSGDYESNVVQIRDAGGKLMTRIKITSEQNTWAHVSDVDLTGTQITSKYPIAVIAGRSRVKDSNDFEAEMMPPVSRWGTVFPIPMQGIANYRLLAAENGTSFGYEGNVEENLDAGHYVNLRLNGTKILKTSKPSLLVQMRDCVSSCSEDNVTKLADQEITEPTNFAVEDVSSRGFFTVIPPAEQYASDQVLVPALKALKRWDRTQFLALLTSYIIDHGVGLHCSYTDNESRLKSTDTSIGKYYLRKIHAAEKWGTIVCAGSNFSVTSYGTNPGTNDNGYAFALCKWSTVSNNQITPSVEEESQTLDEILQEINKTTVSDADSAQRVLTLLANTLENASQPLSAEDIQLAASTLERCADVPGLSNISFRSFVGAVNSIIDQDAGTLADSNVSDKLLSALPLLAANSPVPNKAARENLVVAIEEYDCDVGKGFVEMKDGSTPILDTWPSRAAASNDANVFIYLPKQPDCIVKRSKRNVDTNSSSTIAQSKTLFVLYRNQKLFTSSADNGTIKMRQYKGCKIDRMTSTNYVATSNILTTDRESSNKSKQVARKRHHQRLSSPVNVGFRSENRGKPSLHAQPSCAFWNGDGWSSEGCSLAGTEGGLQICHCNHLTDFTLIVDTLHTDQELCDPNLSAFAFALSLLSITSLIVALLVYAASKYLKYLFSDHRSSRSSTFLQSLTRIRPPREDKSSLSEPLMAAMLAFIFLFVIFADSRLLGLSSFGCRTAAAILYAFLLTQLCWAALAGLSFLKTYYVVFHENTLRFLTKRTTGYALCLSAPPLTTLILWFSQKDFFDREDRFCWIRPDHVAYAIILPLTIFVCADAILTVLLLKSFFFTTPSSKRPLKASLLTQKCLVLFTVQLILAFPWVFQYFTIWTPNTTASHYIFSFAHGSQGCIIAALYLFCYVRWIQTNQPERSSRGPLTTNKNKHVWVAKFSKRFTASSSSTNY